jgi:hypothetical protein
MAAAVCGCKDLHPKSTMRPEDASSPSHFRVRLDLHGNPRLVRRFRAYLETELDDAGMTATATPSSADANIYADLTEEVQPSTLYAGLVSAQFIGNGKTSTYESCPSTSDSDNTPLFDKAAENLATSLHSQFPAARSVAVASGGDVPQQPDFLAQFSTSLQQNGQALTTAPRPDVSARITMKKVTIPITLTVAKYDVSASADGKTLSTWNGADRISAKATTPANECRQNAETLDWLVVDLPLARPAGQIVRLLKQRAKSSDF